MGILFVINPTPEYTENLFIHKMLFLSVLCVLKISV